MKTASFPTTGSSLNVSWLWETNPRPWFHLFIHCSELQELQANETRIINIAVNGHTYFKNETPPYLKTISSAVTLDPKVINQNEIVLSVEQASRSTIPPILNAVELYNVIETDQSETDAGDVLAVTAIKRQHRLQKNWMGDPCLPKFLIWDGLSCSYDGFHIPRIISLNLSSSGLMGEIPTSLANLTQLQSLDLSRNSMQGGIPKYLATLTHLKLLDLSGNKLNGQIPKGLLDRSATGALTLKIGENSGSCSDSGVCGENEKKRSKVAIPIIVKAVYALILLVVEVVILRIRRQKIRQNPAAQNSQGKLWNRGRAKHNNQYLQVPMENREFTYNDLVRITTYFKKEIGRGGFGPTYHGALDKHVEVAVKMLDKTGSSQGPKEFQTEAQILTRIHHKNLVSLVGYCKEIENLALVYEYMSKGSLEDHLRRKSRGINTLKWKERLRIAVEAAQGLEYLHSGSNPSIVHRDVKPNNILLNNNMEAKIADFGISRAFENDICTHITTGVMGTPGYLNPEYYITQKLIEKSDVYSFGVVLLELVTGKPAIFMENGETHNVIHWVQPRLKKFEIDEIVDKRSVIDCVIDVFRE